MRSAVWIYGIAAVLLGAVGLLFHDMPLHPARVANELPNRATVALLSAVGLMLAGSLVIVQRTRRIALLSLAIGYTAYACLFVIPKTSTAISNPGGWLAFCEVAVMALAGIVLWHEARTGRAGWTTAVRILFGVCAVDFAVCHFVYVDITASMIPHFMPAPRFWAQLTGCAHGLTGLALISGVRSRLAASLEAIMCAIFVVLVHIPAVTNAPADRLQWATLATAFAIAAAAWAVRLAPERGGATGSI